VHTSLTAATHLSPSRLHTSLTAATHLSPSRLHTSLTAATHLSPSRLHTSLTAATRLSSSRVHTHLTAATHCPFLVHRLEATYEIREDLADALGRVGAFWDDSVDVPVVSAWSMTRVVTLLMLLI